MTDSRTPQGPLGDTRPDQAYPEGSEDPGNPDPRAEGGKPQEDVEDRPNVGTVEAEDYPAKDRDAAAPTKTQA